MADNTTLNAGAGGDTIATDDIGGIKHQRVKVQFGEDGVASDVTNTNPLPINLLPVAASTLWKVYEATVTATADVLSINTGLGRDARSISVSLSLAAPATVAVSADGAAWSDELSLGAGSSLIVDGLSVHSLRISDATNTATYQLLAY